jgi:hypothetical protein
MGTVSNLLVLSMKRKIDVWEFASRFFVVVQFIIVLVSLSFTQQQIKSTQNATYMEYVFKFNEQLSEPTNQAIALAIEDGRKILKSDGGVFSDDDLDSYLGIYEDLAKALQMNLISKDLFYNDFFDNLSMVYNNKEVRDYLVRIRKDSPDYFSGFESLAKEFENYHPIK